MEGLLTSSLIFVATLTLCSAYAVSDVEWLEYRATFAKAYPSIFAQSTARCNFAFNKLTITSHNTRAAQGLETYTLGVNQFSDLRFFEFAALFPPSTEIPSNAVPFILPTSSAVESFAYADMGYSTPVQDQGEVCNSGWAYAAAAALKILDDVHNAVFISPPLSAQNFIDCAGASRSCVNQVAQSAFDYLAIYRQAVYPVTEYPNKPLLGQGMCVPPLSQSNARTLMAYSRIANGNDEALKKVVNFIAPVVIKFNPGTFEFMHYKGGVFTQPPPIQEASHYMTVVGYGTDALTSKDYWLLQNSFGNAWGENGFIRIERDATKPIANAAIFPYQ